MKRTLPCLSLFLALCLCVVCVAPAEERSWKEEAASIIASMASGDFDAVEAKFDDIVRAQVPVGTLAMVWEQQLVGGYGAYVEMGGAMEVRQGDYWVVQTQLVFEEAQLALTLAFNDDAQIAGINIQPPMEFQEEAPLPLPEGATEQEITLRPGEADETGGLLTLPAGEGPFPAVVLIHGSGASDRDEAVFGVKPFHDLAMGLAAHGVASIRYDKYTYAHPELFDDSILIEQEYERDVHAAVSLLQADERISEIYLVGHSEGGMLLPRLLGVCGDAVSGGVSLAGTPLPLWQTQQHQNETVLASLPEEQRAVSQPIIDAEVEKGNRLLEMSDEELASETVFGIPASYHKDLASVDPIAKAKELGLPLLFLQGEKDFQVLPDFEFAAWQAGLSDEPFATFKLYPDLTHLFIALEGESTYSTDDYIYGGHVADEVIGDIAAWIAER